MTTNHPSEIELQQYAIDNSVCTKASLEHIENCKTCQSETATYQLLFSVIGDQPKPVFDFDLTGLVLSRLPAATPLAGAGHRRLAFSTFLLTTMVFCTAGIPIYLFRKNISNMFDGISSLFLYIIYSAAAVFVLFRILDMYKKFRRQMETINFY
jgi:hypothetical protein